MVAGPPKWQRFLAGVASTAAGTLLMAGVLTALNHHAKGPPKEALSRPTAFDVAPAPPPPRAKRKVRKTKKHRNHQSNHAQMKTPSIGGALGGLAFDLPSVSEAVELGMDNALVGDTSDVVMTAETVDQLPRAIKQRPPEYPRSARKAGVEGEVVLNLLIGKDGRIEKVKVLQSRPAGVFDEAALQAAKRWRFQPARYHGQPVRTWARQPLPFRLGGS